MLLHLVLLADGSYLVLLAPSPAVCFRRDAEVTRGDFISCG